jgi:hypothetical protein
VRAWWPNIPAFGAALLVVLAAVLVIQGAAFVAPPLVPSPTPTATPGPRPAATQTPTRPSISSAIFGRATTGPVSALRAPTPSPTPSPAPTVHPTATTSPCPPSTLATPLDAAEAWSAWAGLIARTAVDVVAPNRFPAGDLPCPTSLPTPTPSASGP